MTETPLNDVDDTGRPLTCKAEFMIIQLGYSCKLLFSIEDGPKFLQTYSQALEWKEEYKKPVEIHPNPPEVKITYLTRAQVNEIRFQKVLGVSPDEIV